MDLIHPSKFILNKSRSLHEIRAAIEQFRTLYPFAISDVSSLEHNLDVLYENKEISVLLRKLTQERDQIVKKRKERRSAKQRRLDEANFGAGVEEQQQEQVTVEDADQFEMADETFLEEEIIEEGTASLQDLLTVISNAGLEDALPQAIILLEIAAVTPLTSVHCERVFSRMKRIVSSSRSRMLQRRKEHLVFLQVEHTLLRWLSKQPGFCENIVTWFKGHNQKISKDSKDFLEDNIL